MKLTQVLLVALATLTVVGTVAIVSSPGPMFTPRVVSPPPSTNPRLSRNFELIDFLPLGFVTDGSVDYSNEVRRAFAAASGGTLRLPNFPVRVSRAPGQSWCVLVEGPMLVEGGPSAALIETQGAVQLLRVRDVSGFTLRDVTLRGLKGHGQGLGHGLLQVFGGSQVHLERVRIDSCDVDGIAVSGVSGLTITGCSVVNASKSALYVNASRRVRVQHNEVTNFGGHRTPSGTIVGTGIQLSSNTDVVCAHNVIEAGVGIGILVNALENGAPPVGTTVAHNRITGVTNPTNGNVSGGIRLANGNSDRRTQTVVTGNSVRACGQNGIYVENHAGALVAQNSVFESERNGILVSTVQAAMIVDNLVMNSGTSGLTNLSQIQLINQATDVVVRGNELGSLEGLAAGAARDAVHDGSAQGSNHIDPFIRFGNQQLAGRPARRGDIALTRNPATGGYVGSICITAGTPGVWKPFGRIEN